MKTASSQRGADAGLQSALHTIGMNCQWSPEGSQQFRDHPKATPEKIKSLARTSPEYQRHVIQRLLTGDQDPFRMIASTLLVYDTVGFKEVTSRLHRAVGSLRNENRYLRQQLGLAETPDRLADRLLTLDLVAEQASELHDLLTAAVTKDVQPGPDVVSSSPRAKQAEKKPPLAKGEVNAKLHSPVALGLIAKNVRNVAVLQDAHRPTADEKRLAISLSGEARDLAAALRNEIRQAFGQADDNCRVRPVAPPVRRVITHSCPDADAIGSAWLAERFLLSNQPVEVLFVPRERVLGAYRVGDCLVDVGNTHDPANLFFDHKRPAFDDRHCTCAARLVWDHLRAQGKPVKHLAELVEAIHAGDSGRHKSPAYLSSKLSGVHAEIVRSAGESDSALYLRVRGYLECHYT